MYKLLCGCRLRYEAQIQYRTTYKTEVFNCCLTIPISDKSKDVIPQVSIRIRKTLYIMIAYIDLDYILLIFVQYNAL